MVNKSPSVLSVLNNIKDDTVNKKKNQKYLLQYLKSHTQTNKHQTPIEQQYYRSHLNLITILISLFLLISITIGVYHIFRYFILKNMSKKSKQIILPTTNIINEKLTLLKSLNRKNKTNYTNVNFS
ncbi:unnamed protein product [Adineta steineri]|uniref:Uncharacterized protein n=1 Tax=Adineta steineri TaxID=433720 RepID=A0A818LJ14_9BILA|nr:unnamed protein product [Adineta steineri]CAF3569377.1 unnamed protein product [Adineta steineri]